MMTYYFTFGQKYRVEEHPTGHFAHPDYLVEVHADSMPQAREIMVERYGPYWSGCYEYEELTLSYYKGLSAWYDGGVWTDDLALQQSIRTPH